MPPSLLNLRLQSPNHKLKHFGIIYCQGLEAIEVVPALNFSCFVYKGPTINMLFTDVPQLSSVSLIGAPNNRIDFCKDSVITKFDQFPFSMSQLQMLALDPDMVVVKSYYLFPNTFPEFRNIR